MLNNLYNAGGWAVAGGLLVTGAGLPFVIAPGLDDEGIPPLEDGFHATEMVPGTVDAPLERFFCAWFRDVKLETILTGSPMMPKAVGSKVVRGTWGEPGAERRVTLEDGSTALETVQAELPPHYFAYRVVPEGGPGRRLLRYIHGEFNLRETPEAKTRIQWRYSLRPRSTAAIPHVLLFASAVIRPFLTNGLAQIVEVGARESRRQV